MPETLQILLKNDSDSSNLHAYIVSPSPAHSNPPTDKYKNRQASHSNTQIKDASYNPTAKTSTSPPQSKR